MAGLLILFFGFVAIVFGRIVWSGWQTSRMVNKMFTLAEREIDRKMQERDAIPTTARRVDKTQCAHCGSSVASEAQCPNCGASLR